MQLSAKGNGCLCTPKGNGIKDGFVSWVCVYAVVFWMLRFLEAILHVYFIFLNGLSVVSVGLVIWRLDSGNLKWRRKPKLGFVNFNPPILFNPEEKVFKNSTLVNVLHNTIFYIYNKVQIIF